VSATKNKALKKDNFACSIIDSFGLKNIADDSSSMSDLNLEAVAIADPDYIFIIFQGKEAEAANVYDDVFKGQAAWRKLSAVQNGRVVVLPKNLFHFKPNAKWDEAYRYIYEIFE
jgi:iron complex transport system substrate-binding protein